MYRRTFLRELICLLIFLNLMSVAHAQQKITGPWLWMIAPTEVNRGGRDSTDVDSLAIASNGVVTESDIATKGANEGDSVGNLIWTLGEISPTGGNNINDTITSIGLGRGDINDHSSYALITLESDFDQNGVTMRVGSDDSVKVWLNGEVVHKSPFNRGAGDFQDTFQVDIKRGDNLLLVKVSERGGAWSMFVGINANVNTVYKPPKPVKPVIVSISPSRIQSPASGEQLVLNLNVADGEDVAGYQATVQFDTTALRYVSSANGSYLPAGAFVVPPVVSGNQVTLGATSLNGGSQGDGTLATVTFEVVAVKPSSLILSEVKLTDMNADFLSVSSENGEVVGPDTPTEASDTETVVSLTPSPVASPDLGEQLTFNVSIVNGKNVAGYAFKLAFDTTALRYISSGNADYLPTGAFVIPPLINENQVTLAAASLNGRSQGEGTLATFTFEVVAVKPSTLRFSEVSLTDSDANVLPVSSENGEVVEPVRVPADVNGDGVVDLEDMDLAASRLNQRGENTADVNGDGVVDAADLLLIAAAVEQGNAAPSLHPKSIAEMFTATEVQQWLQFAHQHGLTGAKYQRGVILLEQFLLILMPKETVVLPNYPNPFNPETWIPYHLSNAAEVHISIYAADGKLVRRLWLGHQAAGIYESRSRAAYWDGRNALGESVASGVYFYTLTAGDFTATRKLLIRK